MACNGNIGGIARDILVLSMLHAIEGSLAVLVIASGKTVHCACLRERWNFSTLRIYHCAVWDVLHVLCCRMVRVYCFIPA